MKKIIGGILALSLCMCSVVQGADYSGQTFPVETGDVERTSEEILKEMLPAGKEDLAAEGREAVQKIAEVSVTDAGAAAELLNQTEDEKVFEAGVKEVLDGYYVGIGEAGMRDKIHEFSEVISERAEEMLKNYREAQEERDNAGNLSYEPGYVLAIFQVGTTDEEIYRIGERMGKGANIISDYTIAPDLPEEKRKRLEECKVEEIPIAGMDIGMDKTVARAVSILEKLPCVKSASPNSYAYPAGADELINTGKRILPKKLAANRKKVVLYVGGTVKLKIKAVKPAQASKKVRWKSKNPKLAAVSKGGKLRAKRPGKTVVTAVSVSNPRVKVKVKVTVRPLKCGVK